MNIEQKIKMLCACKGISQRKLAEMVGQTPSNFNTKMKRQTFTQEELEKIAQVCEVVYVFGFEMPDGTRI